MKRTKSTTKTILYGVHPVQENFRARKRLIEEIYISRDTRLDSLTAQFEIAGIPVSKMNPKDLAAFCGSQHHQGIAASVGPFPYTDLSDLTSQGAEGLLVILDEIQDPSNLGTILRSCHCLGASGVVLTKDRAVPVTPAVEKAAAGASAYVPVARIVNLAREIERLKELGFWIYAADARASSSVYAMDLTEKIAIVFGSEFSGIRRLVREKCDGTISIPMLGTIDSLNVAQTATVILAESLRQRLAKKPELLLHGSQDSE